MNARQFREMADRCRELQMIADRDDIREQLSKWKIEFDAEADVLETSAKYGRGDRGQVGLARHLLVSG